ncbi:MAG: hypothetical protein QOE70_2321 [Chthoniobacter sp.]|jgi:uncharacterized membrane protein (DUF2068 family)|nr:hypothetical protein [Chthoniobacter sp.]
MHQRAKSNERETRHPGDQALWWIAGYNLGKGLLLLTLALSFLGFLHKDVDTIVGHWISWLGISLENEHVVILLARLDLVTDKQLKVLSGVTFLLGGVFVTEGIGLFFKQRWAEYLTVVVTASFIPVEIFESLRHWGPAKFILLVVNVVIVWLLVRILREGSKPMVR